jgi:hypothetical protein
MKEFVETLIGRLEECKKIEKCNLYSGIEEGFGYSHCSDAFEDGQTLGAFNAYSSMLDFIKELAEEYNNGWISCSERLPQLYENTSDVVLVCDNDDYQHMAFWCSDGKWRYCQSGMIKNPMEWTVIIAWQPLPAPYKKGSETDE